MQNPQLFVFLTCTGHMELGCCKHCINYKYSHSHREHSDTSHKLETVFLKLGIGFRFQLLMQQLVQILDFRSVIYIIFKCKQETNPW